MGHGWDVERSVTVPADEVDGGEHAGFVAAGAGSVLEPWSFRVVARRVQRPAVLVERRAP